MAISVNWPTRIITVPKADTTLIQSSPTEIRELDIDDFRKALKDLEDDEGMPFLDTHSHNTTVTVGGVTLARVVSIINGYTVTFEDGQYAVNLVGANSNLSDVTNVNQVSIRSANSAGLIESGVSGLTASESAILTLLEKLMRNKLVTDPGTGTMTLYDDDGTTVLLSGILYEDAAGTTQYQGQGSERRERLA